MVFQLVLTVLNCGGVTIYWCFKYLFAPT